MSLNTASRRVIKADSQAAIRAEGLLGDEYVEGSLGSEEEPEVKDNATLHGESPVEVSDIIKKVDGLLDQAGGAVQNVTEAWGISTAPNYGQGQQRGRHRGRARE